MNNLVTILAAAAVGIHLAAAAPALSAEYDPVTGCDCLGCPGDPGRKAETTSQTVELAQSPYGTCMQHCTQDGDFFRCHNICKHLVHKAPNGSNRHLA